MIYPTVGCGTYTTLHYLRDPNASQYELGKSCFKGATHRANFGTNFIGSSFPTMLMRYQAGIVFADASTRAVDVLLSPDKNNVQYSCPFYAGDEQ